MRTRSTPGLSGRDAAAVELAAEREGAPAARQRDLGMADLQPGRRDHPGLALDRELAAVDAQVQRLARHARQVGVPAQMPLASSMTSTGGTMAGSGRVGSVPPVGVGAALWERFGVFIVQLLSAHRVGVHHRYLPELTDLDGGLRSPAAAHADLQHAVAVARLDRVRVDVVGQADDAAEAAESARPDGWPCRRRTGGRGALAGQRQHAASSRTRSRRASGREGPDLDAGRRGADVQWVAAVAAAADGGGRVGAGLELALQAVELGEQVAREQAS